VGRSLQLLHTVFLKEHNLIASRLAEEYPAWGDEELFQTSRLILSGLLAKIHTVEWTPVILNNLVLRLGININWYGLYEGPVRVLGPQLAAAVPVSQFEGVPGVLGLGHDTYLADTPMSMTEEFVSAYRMHQFLTDFVVVPGSDTKLCLNQTVFQHSQRQIEKHGVENMLKAFGRQPAGALTLHNYPQFLTHLELPTGDVVNMAVVDLFRDRERGVPRYNDARRIIGSPPLSTFEELSDDPVVVEELKDIYNCDIEQVDGTKKSGSLVKRIW